MEKPEHIKHDEAEREELLKNRAHIKRSCSISGSDASGTPVSLLRSLSHAVSSPLSEAAIAEKAEEEEDEPTETKKEKQEEEKEEEPKAPIGRILLLSKPEWPGIFGGALFTLVAVLPDSLTPALFGKATQALTTDGMSGVNFWMVGIMLLAVSSALLGFIKGYIFGVAGERVVLRLRQQLLEAIITSDISKLDKTQSGEFVSRLTTDVMNVQGVATTAFVTLFTNICSLVVMLVVMFIMSWQLTTFLIVCVPAFMGLIIPMSKVSGKFASKYQSELAKATSIAQEIIANFRTVRAFAAEKHSVDRYQESLGDLKKTRFWWMKDTCVYRLGVQKVLFQSLVEPFIGFGFALCIYGSLWYALYLASKAEFDMGLIFTFMMFSFQMMGKIGGIAGTFGQVISASVAAGKIFAIIDAKPEIPVKGGKRPETVIGEVTFEDIEFTYPGTSEPVLTALNCTVPPQTSAAFVGQSGCGKSTTLRLLERFYDVSKGRVCIDGNDVRELDGSWIRMNVAFVQQEPNLFAMTVRENVAYSQMAAKANLESTNTISEAANSLTSIGDGTSVGGVTDEQVVQACKLANAHDFIQNLENQYDTMVGERGMKLSGGQKQRVAIARAIIKDPKIMLLDEATSALDSESEHLVSEAISNMMRGRTVLLVAHRLSTVKDATSIHFVKDGKILASGSHSNLLYYCPEYEHLVQHQMA